MERKMRYTDKELSAIKNTFADNESLLIALRKSFLQLPMKKEEVVMIKGLNKETKDLIRKTFVPEIDGDAPLFQMADLFVGVGSDIKERDIESAYPRILAKDLEKKYLNQQMNEIETEKKGDISFKELINISGKNESEAFINVTAFNYLLSYIDSQLNQLQILAGSKDETVEQTKDRLFKDSSR